MKEIQLTKGKVAIVDDSDFEWLSKDKWYCSNYGYAVRNKKIPRQGMIWMHREITQAPAGMEVDHINGDALDNQKSNLRICTGSQNKENTRRRTNNQSGYKGVHWHKQPSGHDLSKGWRAVIKKNKNTIHLGYFDNPVEAALAYDEAAKKYFGEFAKTNFPD
jgi:hypothetical protein